MEHYFAILSEKDIALPIYAAGLGTDDTQQTRVRENGLMHYQLAYCEKGRGKYNIHGKEYIIEPDMFFFFEPGIPHSYYPTEEPWTVRWLLFNGTAADILMEASGLKYRDVFYLNNPNEFYHCCHSIRSMVTQKEPTEIIKVSGILYSFITSCSSNMNNRQNTAPDSCRIITKQAAAYISNHYNHDLTLQELADYSGVSESYLCRVFRKYYGEPPLSYLIHYRINESKKMLINKPQMNIKDIAAEVGFTDHSYFGATFRRYEGCSPKQFRNMFHNKP